MLSQIYLVICMMPTHIYIHSQKVLDSYAKHSWFKKWQLNVYYAFLIEIDVGKETIDKKSNFDVALVVKLRKWAFEHTLTSVPSSCVL